MKQFKKAEFLGRLGALILKMRKSRGLSQDKLTEEAGLAKGTVSRIESGSVDPQATTLGKLAHALDVPPTQVFDVKI